MTDLSKQLALASARRDTNGEYLKHLLSKQMSSLSSKEISAVIAYCRIAEDVEYPLTDIEHARLVVHQLYLLISNLDTSPYFAKPLAQSIMHKMVGLLMRIDPDASKFLPDKVMAQLQTN